MEERIYHILQIFQENIGITATFEPNTKRKDVSGYIEITNDDERQRMPAVFKKDVKYLHLVQFLELKEEIGDFIIVAEVIYPATREQLRALKLNYLDLAGNSYLRKEDWFFFLEGYKNKVPTPPQKAPGFTKTGLMLIFHFLNDETYLNATYRQMAKDYGIALGNITKIITALKRPVSLKKQKV
ncbi:hypothetical protein [Pedobacter gandavensis]|uniref:hypothetical protein n=1 Tax=Pedobacter gandavensis TaxID=2679963 RepID=UPI00292E52BC|nr:hypothetical protein [Pedobacter gandavensis]